MLHAGHYLRKPRGGPRELPDEQRRRFSFCCARRECRKRALAPSLRFLGRRVYFAACFLLVCAARHGLTRDRARRLRELVGVSVRTLARWRKWWQAAFRAGPFWKVHRGRFAPPVDVARLPHSLLERFCGSLRDQVRALLRFLLPLTPGAPAGVLAS